MMSKRVEVKKRMLGGFTVGYDCPRCNARLTSPLDDAGKEDTCPECGGRFTVPGTEERIRINDESLAAERRMREEKERQAKLEQQLLAKRNEELKQQAAERQRAAKIEEPPNAHARQESKHASAPLVQAIVQGMQARPAEGSIVISSGAICADYNTLGLVVSFASKTEGCGGAIAVESVYQSALQRLIESALARGANGLIFVNFQNRVAIQSYCGSSQRVFEVFAWGTAVHF